MAAYPAARFHFGPLRTLSHRTQIQRSRSASHTTCLWHTGIPHRLQSASGAASLADLPRRGPPHSLHSPAALDN